LFGIHFVQISLKYKTSSSGWKKGSSGLFTALKYTSNDVNGIYIYLYCLHDLEIYIHTYTKQKNNNEKKVKKEKKNNKQKYMNKQLHSKTGINDTN